MAFNRPVTVFSLLFCLGIITAWISDSYLFVLFVSCGLAISALLLGKEFKKHVFFLITALAFFLMGGFEYIHVSQSCLERFQHYRDKEVEIKGRIDSVPEIKGTLASWAVDVDSIRYDGKIENVRGKVLVYSKYEDESHVYDYGRFVDIRGKLSIPKGKRNPGGFDYRMYLAGKGISAILYPAQGDIELKNEIEAGFLSGTGIDVRKSIIDIINESLPEQQAGLLNGMLIGSREGLSKDVQAVFSDSGLTHIMAVSGSNVAFIVFPLLFLFKRFGIGRRTSSLLTICIVVFFVYVTGFEPSVARAAVMAVVVLFGRAFIREPDIYTSIGLSALVLLLYNPLLLFNTGFQMSYGATIAIILFYKNLKDFFLKKHLPGPISDVLAVTTAAQLGVMPIALYYFNQVSLISILSNILVVPLTQFVTIIGFLMAITGQLGLFLPRMLGYANCSLLSFILYVADISSKMPFAVLRLPTPSVPVIILYYAVLVCVLWYIPASKIKVSTEHYVFSGAAAMSLVIFISLVPKSMEVVFLDVGQGDSAFIRTAGGKTVLIDGGGQRSSLDNSSTMGDTVVIPFLLDYGVAGLDIVVATHGHDDHVKGLLPVLGSFPVKNLILPENEFDEDGLHEVRKEAKEGGAVVTSVSRGDRIKLDKHTYMDILHPKRGTPILESSLNNGSIVLKLDYKDTEVLFTGDIESEAENLLIEDGVNIESDVIKVPHHGSDTSSTREFLYRTGAKAAVISVGANNYGHPSQEVLNRLSETAGQVFRTDGDGGVILKSDGRKIKISKTVTVKQ